MQRPPPPPLDDLAELDELEEPAPRPGPVSPRNPVSPPAEPTERSEAGPLLVVYLWALVLGGLCLAWYFLKLFWLQDILLLFGVPLYFALMTWLLVLWILGSVTAGTSWRFCLGAACGMVFWAVVCRFFLGFIPQANTDVYGAFTFLEGLPYVVVGSGLFGWMILRLFRRKPGRKSAAGRKPPPPLPLPPGKMPLPPVELVE
jgi:hypothetical protein